MARKTAQREEIRSVFQDAGRPLSVSEVLESAQRNLEGIGQATVYRAVADLLDDGFLRSVELPGEPARYELADLGHHHHFHCKACGKVYDVPGCAHDVTRLAPKGFAVEGHEIILYGRCAACRKGRTERQGVDA